MNTTELEIILRRVIDDKFYLPLWVYFLCALIIPFLGSFFGSYFKKKAENVATKEDFEELLVQLKKTTSETEKIRVDLAKGNWLHQQSWSLKEKYYSGLLEALNSLKMSLLNRLDHYMEPGSEYLDSDINENEHFKNQEKIGYEAFVKIQQMHGPAEVVISQRAIDGLKEFYSTDWYTKNNSICNKDYLDRMYASVNEVHKLVLEEARLELVKSTCYRNQNALGE